MGLNLKNLRREKAMTQQQLADAVGATKRQIGAWERGENDIPMDFAVSIADVFDCTVDQIAGRSYTVPVLTLDWTERTIVRLFRSMDDSTKELFIETARKFARADNMEREERE